MENFTKEKLIIISSAIIITADRYIIPIVGEFIGTDTVMELLLCSKQDFIMQEFARQTILSYQNVP